MFDIKEYYQEKRHYNNINVRDISDIEGDISYELDSLIKNRFDSLYRRDRYKINTKSIEIIYPVLSYPGKQSLLITPDKIRFLLSSYPDKQDLNIIEKIVIKPKYIEIGNVELVSLYLKNKKILVLYTSHPHFYRYEDLKVTFNADFSELKLNELSKFYSGKEPEVKTENCNVHSLWHIISVISHGISSGEAESEIRSTSIDKFFVRRDSLSEETYHHLNDISFYYSRHGY